MHYELFRDKSNLLSTSSQGEGVYIRFGGDTKQEIFYLATIPTGADVEEAMQYIVHDLQNLEKGVAMPYGPTGTVEYFYGGVLLFVGKLIFNTYFKQ